MQNELFRCKKKLTELDDQACDLSICKIEIWSSLIMSSIIISAFYFLTLEIINKYNDGNLTVVILLIIILLAIILIFLSYNLIKYLSLIKSLKNEKIKLKDKLNKINLEIKSILKRISDEDLIKLDNNDNDTQFKHLVSKEIKNELVKRCAEKLNIKNKENQKNDFLHEILINKNSKKVNIKNE